MHILPSAQWVLLFHPFGPHSESDLDGKESACNAGVLGSIPGPGRSPRDGNGYPLQYSCLENSMDRGAWWATVHGVSKSQTRLSDEYFHFYSESVSLSSDLLITSDWEAPNRTTMCLLTGFFFNFIHFSH